MKIEIRTFRPGHRDKETTTVREQREREKKRERARERKKERQREKDRETKRYTDIGTNRHEFEENT